MVSTLIHYRPLRHTLEVCLSQKYKLLSKTHPLEQVGGQVRQVELTHVTALTDSAREAWMSTQDSMDRLRPSAAERKWFFTKLAFYEERGKDGRLLAKIARSQQQSPAIGAIQASSGRMVNSPEDILSELASFYVDLYGSREAYSNADLANYMSNIDLPTLSNKAKQLDAPLTLKELQLAACSFPACKAPGEDGLPLEVYTQFGEQLLPKLLEVFNASLEEGCLYGQSKCDFTV